MTSNFHIETDDARFEAALDFGVQLLLQLLLVRLVDELSVTPSVFGRANLAQDGGLDVSAEIANAAHVAPILSSQSILRHHIVLISGPDSREHLLIQVLFQDLEILQTMLVYDVPLEVVRFHVFSVLVGGMVVLPEEIRLLSLLINV